VTSAVNSSSPLPLRILIADDEAPARMRLRDLLGDIASSCPTELAGFAANGVEALRLQQEVAADVVLADINMPVMDGIELARHLNRLPAVPAVIFTTAFDEHAIQAFELAAVDYLLKPVRAERLEKALRRAAARLPTGEGALAGLAARGRQHFSVSERGRILLIPVQEVLYLRAELKYVTARTVEREFLLDESLIHLEQEFAERFIRIHRNSLVARNAITGVEYVGEGGEGHWEVLLNGVEERLPISRRQWPAVKSLLKM